MPGATKKQARPMLLSRLPRSIRVLEPDLGAQFDAPAIDAGEDRICLPTAISVEQSVAERPAGIGKVAEIDVHRRSTAILTIENVVGGSASLYCEAVMDFEVLEDRQVGVVDRLAALLISSPTGERSPVVSGGKIVVHDPMDILF